MKHRSCDVVIIGAGLTGLCLGYLLRDQGLDIKILEARDRIGGRILTLYEDGRAPQEMGATWLGAKHEHLNNLLKMLDIKIFEQVLGDTAIYEPISTSPPQIVRLPPNNDPSYRIAGGTSELINQLAAHLEEASVQLGQVVSRIEERGNKVAITAADITYEARYVVSTLPPYLFNHSIDISPPLPAQLVDVINGTHTWMGESIKIGLTYKTPFWREKGSSGTIMSNVGPIPEMYDHANYEDDTYALIGFLNGSYHGVTRDQRLELIMSQLQKYYGDLAMDYVSYDEVVWSQEIYTHAPYAAYMIPHQNNGHRIYRQSYMNGKLYVAGTETAAANPGYMEGAIRSAAFVSSAISTL